MTTRRFLTTLIVAAVLSLPLANVQAEKPERHPMIRGAIHSLEQAKEELKHAAHDFGGHRAEALAACEKAIEQLRKALEYDRR